MDLNFIDRMQREYNSLDDKIFKLEKALKSLQNLDKREKELIIFQKQAMKSYQESLHQRIVYANEKYRKRGWLK